MGDKVVDIKAHLLCCEAYCLITWGRRRYAVFLHLFMRLLPRHCYCTAASMALIF